MKKSIVLTLAAAVGLILVLGVRQHTAAGNPPPSKTVSSHVGITALSPDELGAKIGEAGWLIVEFGGQHCIPCMKMQPVLEKVQQALGDRGEVHNFWIQEHVETARRLRIMVMPTQVVFDPKGNEVFRHQGFVPYDEFIEALTARNVL